MNKAPHLRQRQTHPGGFLNVEGEPSKEPITRADLYRTDLTGHANSAAFRQALTRRLSLPSHLGTSALVDALNVLLDREELYTLAEELRPVQG